MAAVLYFFNFCAREGKYTGWSMVFVGVAMATFKVNITCERHKKWTIRYYVIRLLKGVCRAFADGTISNL